jgi:hypothetical protein
MYSPSSPLVPNVNQAYSPTSPSGYLQSDDVKDQPSFKPDNNI